MLTHAVTGKTDHGGGSGGGVCDSDVACRMQGGTSDAGEGIAGQHFRNTNARQGNTEDASCRNWDNGPTTRCDAEPSVARYSGRTSITSDRGVIEEELEEGVVMLTWLTGILLLIVCDVYMLLNHASYRTLFYLNVFSPVFYVAGAVLYAVIQPRREESNRDVFPNVKDDQDHLRDLDGKRSDGQGFDGNAGGRRLMKRLRKFLVRCVHMEFH
jgi:hypothetical protein